MPIKFWNQSAFSTLKLRLLVSVSNSLNKINTSSNSHLHLAKLAERISSNSKSNSQTEKIELRKWVMGFIQQQQQLNRLPISKSNSASAKLAERISSNSKSNSLLPNQQRAVTEIEGWQRFPKPATGVSVRWRRMATISKTSNDFPR
ncbi:hypothetical protein Droror1_Dr00016173 [Drosera rotundifolia]